MYLVLGMGRLIAIHGYRGFKAHGSVHRRQFAYRGFFSIFYKFSSLSLGKGITVILGKDKGIPTQSAALLRLRVDRKNVLPYAYHGV